MIYQWWYFIARIKLTTRDNSVRATKKDRSNYFVLNSNTTNFCDQIYSFQRPDSLHRHPPRQFPEFSFSEQYSKTLFVNHFHPIHQSHKIIKSR